MYLLFAGSNYYPVGGWNDFCGTFNSVEEAKEALFLLSTDNSEWCHVVHGGKIVWEK